MHRLKTIGVAGATVALLLSASVAFAEETQVGIEQRTDAREEAKAKIEAKREEAKKKIEIHREEAKKRAETTREEAKTRMETSREVAKQKMETQREEAKQKMETARENAKAKMETKREEAKQRLSDIRDKKKQELALKLANQFEELNKKWTDHFTEQLGRFSEIILKIQERADTAASNGKDVTSTNVAIQSATTAISTAQTAVTAQASKTYVLDTSSVTTTVATTTTNGQDELIKGLRTQFQNLHKTLFKDLFALRDGVMKDAKRAIQDALKTLGNVPNVDEENATSTDKSNQ